MTTTKATPERTLRAVLESVPPLRDAYPGPRESLRIWANNRISSIYFRWASEARDGDLHDKLLIQAHLYRWDALRLSWGVTFFNRRTKNMDPGARAYYEWGRSIGFFIGESGGALPHWIVKEVEA